VGPSCSPRSSAIAEIAKATAPANPRKLVIGTALSALVKDRMANVSQIMEIIERRLLGYLAKYVVLVITASFFLCFL
jgi:hypothetical protein